MICKKAAAFLAALLLLAAGLRSGLNSAAAQSRPGSFQGNLNAGGEAPLKRPSVALVLGGGAARGFAHAAVLELIEELEIPIDMVIGVSAGAIVGGLYSAGYSPAMIMDALGSLDYTPLFDDRPVSPFGEYNGEKELPLAFGLKGALALERGFSSGENVYALLKSLTVKIPSGLDFDRLPIPFRAGVVEAATGRFELLDRGDLAEAVRASVSIPGVFEPFVIDGRAFVDGGVINNLPVKAVREMGFDIVIAVDLFAPPGKIKTSPLDVPDFMMILYSGMTGAERDFADALLLPNLEDFSLMDYEKAREIYAVKNREELSRRLSAVKEKTAVRKAGAARAAGAKPAYAALPALTAGSLKLNGALAGDKAYFERAFAKLLRGKALDENNTARFLDQVHAAGNYRQSAIRVYPESGELELILRLRIKDGMFFRAGLDYQGSLVFPSLEAARPSAPADSFLFSSALALRGALELRGLGGFASSLMIRASIADELSFGLLYFKPFGQNFFLYTEADISRDQRVLLRGFLPETAAAERLLDIHASIGGGLRFDRNNTLTLEPEIFYYEQEGSGGRPLASIAAAYIFDTFNHPLFPTRGFRGKLENRAGLALLPAGAQPEAFFDRLSLEAGAAIPFNSRFSLAFSAFGGSVFGGPEIPLWLPVFGFNACDRIYFPHVTDAGFSGRQKAALSLAFQFEPRKSLTLAGGRLVFSLAASVGSVGSFDQDMAGRVPETLFWNASFGAALIPVRSFAVNIRAGAGGGPQGSGRPLPFIALDIGSFR